MWRSSRFVCYQQRRRSIAKLNRLHCNPCRPGRLHDNILSLLSKMHGETLALQARRSACAARTWQRTSMSSWGPTTRWRLSSSAPSRWPSTSGTAWTWTASGRPATPRHRRTWQQC